jgi:hypothetical protein
MIKPKDFQLTVNYRSHAGILNCANSVIELIKKFWLYSIDNLAAEEGVIDGPKPMFYTSSDENFEVGPSVDETRNSDLRVSQPLYPEIFVTESGSSIEFGSQQCALILCSAWQLNFTRENRYHCQTSRCEGKFAEGRWGSCNYLVSVGPSYFPAQSTDILQHNL